MTQAHLGHSSLETVSNTTAQPVAMPAPPMPLLLFPDTPALQSEVANTPVQTLRSAASTMFARPSGQLLPTSSSDWETQQCSHHVSVGPVALRKRVWHDEAWLPLPSAIKPRLSSDIAAVSPLCPRLTPPKLIALRHSQESDKQTSSLASRYTEDDPHAPSTNVSISLEANSEIAHLHSQFDMGLGVPVTRPNSPAAPDSSEKLSTTYEPLPWLHDETAPRSDWNVLDPASLYHPECLVFMPMGPRLQQPITGPEMTRAHEVDAAQSWVRSTIIDLPASKCACRTLSCASIGVDWPSNTHK
jgi:hypothetical protein